MKNRKIMWGSILLISLASVGFLGWRFYSGSELNALEREVVASQEVENHSDESTESEEEVETFPEEEEAVVEYKPFAKEDVLGI